METLFLIISILIGASIVTLNVLSALLDRTGAFSKISAVLHPFLFISTFLAGAELIVLAVVMMASVAFLTLVNYIGYKHRRDKNDL